MPQLPGAEDHQEAQPGAQQRHGGLGHHQEVPPVEAVRHQAGHGRQEELRPQLQGHGDAHGPRVMVCQMVKDQPVLGGALHPGADIGYQGANEPEPVVEDMQGLEGGHHRRPPCCLVPVISTG